MSRSRKPTPEHVKTICSICGLDWDKHPDEPTVYDCVELLKVEATKPPVLKYVPYYPHWWVQPTPQRETPIWESPTITRPTPPTITCASVGLALEAKSS